MSARSAAAYEELGSLLQDKQDFPINYNHYYTDTIAAKRRKRLENQILEKIPDILEKATHYVKPCAKQAFDSWGNSASADMEEVGAEEALDCLLAIYKVRTRIAYSNVLWRGSTRMLTTGPGPRLK